MPPPEDPPVPEHDTPPPGDVPSPEDAPVPGDALSPGDVPAPEGDITRFLNEHRAGDPAAMNALLRHTYERFRILARGMLRSFPKLRGEVDTVDVLNQAVLDIRDALEQTSVKTSSHYLRLGARLMRHQLIDLARRLRHRPVSESGLDQLPGADGGPGERAQISEFHEAVERLPDDLREVVELTVYQGLKQAEAAALLEVSERTVRRRWLLAAQLLGPHFSGGGDS